MNTKSKHKRKDGLQRQAQLMSIALYMFSEKGYNATSVDDIIKEAGIAKRTFYLHFDSKAELLDKIIDTYILISYQYIKVLDISMEIPVVGINKFFVDMASYLSNVPELRQFSKLILRELPGLNEYFLKKITDFYNEVIKMLAGYYKLAQDENRVLPGLDHNIVATCFIGSVKELLFNWLILNKNIDMESAIKTVVDLFYKGTHVD